MPELYHREISLPLCQMMSVLAVSLMGKSGREKSKGPMTPGQMVGYYDGISDTVLLYVVSGGGYRLLKVS